MRPSRKEEVVALIVFCTIRPIEWSEMLAVIVGGVRGLQTSPRSSRYSTVYASASRRLLLTILPHPRRSALRPPPPPEPNQNLGKTGSLRRHRGLPCGRLVRPGLHAGRRLLHRVLLGCGSGGHLLVRPHGPPGEHRAQAGRAIAVVEEYGEWRPLGEGEVGRGEGGGGQAGERFG